MFLIRTDYVKYIEKKIFLVNELIACDEHTKKHFSLDIKRVHLLKFFSFLRILHSPFVLGIKGETARLQP
jgi:hypothetical protein